MPSRTGRILSAILINFLVSVPLVATARSEAAAAEGCLSAPGSGTPAGSHWRYRIDHVNKRNCWYLRNDSGAMSQTLPQNNTTTAAPPQAPAKPSIADARAEFRPQDTAVANPPANTAGTPANSAGNETGSADTSIRNPTAAVATRWPDLPAAGVPGTAPTAATSTNDAPQPAADPAQAIIPSLPLGRFSVSMQPETILTLVAAVLGALAFAGAAALISRRSRRRPHRHMAQSARGPLWETTDDDRIVLSDQPYPDAREYRPRFARGVAGATAAHRPREAVRRPPRHATR